MITASHLHPLNPAPSAHPPPAVSVSLPHRDALHVLLDWEYVTLSGDAVHLLPLPALRPTHHCRAPLLPGRFNPLITEELHHIHLSRAALHAYLTLLRGAPPGDDEALGELRRGGYLTADDTPGLLPPAPHPFDAALAGAHTHYLGEHLSLLLRAASRTHGPVTPERVTSAARHLHAQLGRPGTPPSIHAAQRALSHLTDLGYLPGHRPSTPPLPDATHPGTLGRAPFVRFGPFTRQNLLYHTEVHTLDPASLQLYRTYGHLSAQGHVPTVHTPPHPT